MATEQDLQRDHGGDGSDHGVLEDSQLAPEQQHPDRDRKHGERRRPVITVALPSPRRPRLLLSHGPRRAAAERR